MVQLTIDGARFSTLDEFWNEVERVLIPGATWGRNLDAFNDILAGGFGTPEGGFRLVWLNARRSREVLRQFEVLVEIIREHPEITLELR